MIASTCGTISAAIAPWSIREATSISGFAAKPHSAEASGEAADAEQEQPLAAVDVAEPAAGDQAGGEGERVAGGDPLDLR